MVHRCHAPPQTTSSSIETLVGSGPLSEPLLGRGPCQCEACLSANEASNPGRACEGHCLQGHCLQLICSSGASVLPISEEPNLCKVERRPRPMPSLDRRMLKRKRTQGDKATVGQFIGSLAMPIETLAALPKGWLLVGLFPPCRLRSKLCCIHVELADGLRSVLPDATILFWIG